MKTKAFALICLLACFFFISATIQKDSKNKKITIMGTVLDVNESPLVNAMILVDGKQTHTYTNDKGTYKVKVKPDALRIGVFTISNGFREEDIAGRTLIDFTFSSRSVHQSGINATSTPSQEDVSVNTGYSTVKKKNLTTDVSVVNPSKSGRHYTNIGEMLENIAGMRNGVIQGSRNIYGSVPPLIVVDGIPSDRIPSISPDMVESISVLKGTAAAIYGVRGYGGAIIITTKKFDSNE